MKIEILGTEYNVKIDTEENDLKLTGLSGYNDLYAKEIVLKKLNTSRDSTDRLDLAREKVLLHEIVHAFFIESGLTSYCDDEVLIDWISLQLEKINKSITEAKKIFEDDVT